MSKGDYSRKYCLRNQFYNKKTKNSPVRGGGKKYKKSIMRELKKRSEGENIIKNLTKLLDTDEERVLSLLILHKLKRRK